MKILRYFQNNVCPDSSTGKEETKSYLSAAITVDIVRMLSNEETRLLSIVTLLLKEFCPLAKDSSNFRPPVSKNFKIYNRYIKEFKDRYEAC
jgi:hypothetical protein